MVSRNNTEAESQRQSQKRFADSPHRGSNVLFVEIKLKVFYIIVLCHQNPSEELMPGGQQPSKVVDSSCVNAGQQPAWVRI